jgi:hypothetical protein
MMDDRRRYRLRSSMRPPPSNRGAWLRVALYVGLLFALLAVQHQIGDRAAGCLAFFGP